MKYFNTTFGLSMALDGLLSVKTINEKNAADFLRQEGLANVANPTHGNSLQAISQKLGVDVRAAQGGRVTLQSGDEVLVAEIGGIPRETREFSDSEIAAATFRFRLVRVVLVPDPEMVRMALAGDGGAVSELAELLLG